jgi:hypothetical protein
MHDNTQQDDVVPSVHPKRHSPKWRTMVIIWVICVPITFAVTYGVAWSSSNNIAFTGVLQKYSFYPFHDLLDQIHQYHNDYGTYPKTPFDLVARTDSQIKVPQDKVEALKKQAQELFVDHIGQPVFYEKTEEGFRLISFGLDNKVGGEGIYVDIILDNPEEFLHVYSFSDLVQPTFRQFLFEMPVSGKVFRIALFLNLLLSIAIALECARMSFRHQMIYLIIHCFVLVPFCAMFSLLLISLQIQGPYSGH